MASFAITIMIVAQVQEGSKDNVPGIEEELEERFGALVGWEVTILVILENNGNDT